MATTCVRLVIVCICVLLVRVHCTHAPCYLQARPVLTTWFHGHYMRAPGCAARIVFAYCVLTACLVVLNVCLLHDYCMLTTCVLHVGYMLTTCVLHAYGLHTTCVIHAYYMRTTCLLLGYYMRTTWVSHAHGLHWQLLHRAEKASSMALRLVCASGSSGRCPEVHGG